MINQNCILELGSIGRFVLTGCKFVIDVLKNYTYLEMRTFCVFLRNTTFRDKALLYRSFLY